MDVEKFEKLVNDCPDLLRITTNILSDSFYKIMEYKIDLDKSWVDNGSDYLDLIEMSMDIESSLGVVIPDYIWEIIFAITEKPMDIKVMLREIKLHKIGL